MKAKISGPYTAMGSIYITAKRKRQIRAEEQEYLNMRENSPEDERSVFSSYVCTLYVTKLT